MADILIWPALTLSVVAIIYAFSAFARVTKINKNLTLLVRQLAPTEHGLPIEIYVFSADKNWINYEGIQSDIFDHLLAVLPEFGLRVFQQPTGSDFQTLRLNTN